MLVVELVAITWEGPRLAIHRGETPEAPTASAVPAERTPAIGAGKLADHVERVASTAYAEPVSPEHLTVDVALSLPLRSCLQGDSKSDLAARLTDIIGGLV